VYSSGQWSQAVIFGGDLITTFLPTGGLLRRYNQVFRPAPDAQPVVIPQDVMTTLDLLVNGDRAPTHNEPHNFTAGVTEAIYCMRYATLLEWLGVR
jgi:hypothetical protein